MRIQKQTKMWKTKEGLRIRICDMTTDHVNNCIRLLERRAEETRNETMLACMGHGFDSDSMAAYYADQEADRLMSEGLDVEEVFPIYTSLCDERDRRSLIAKQPATPCRMTGHPEHSRT